MRWQLVFTINRNARKPADAHGARGSINPNHGNGLSEYTQGSAQVALNRLWGYNTPAYLPLNPSHLAALVGSTGFGIQSQGNRPGFIADFFAFFIFIVLLTHIYMYISFTIQICAIARAGANALFTCAI